MSVAIGLFFILIGLFHLAFPYASWYLSIGWKIRDAEPSDGYLVLTRVGGGLAAGIGLIVLVVGIVQAVQVTVQQSHKLDGWQTFQREMTVNNIIAIGEQYQSAKATSEQIKAFVADIKDVNLTFGVTGGNTFSAMDSFTITCRDGYQASLINVDNNGTFGIASGTAWLAPDYEFNSDSLNTWAQQFISAGAS